MAVSYRELLCIQVRGVGLTGALIENYLVQARDLLSYFSKHLSKCADRELPRPCAQQGVIRRREALHKHDELNTIYHARNVYPGAYI